MFLRFYSRRPACPCTIPVSDDIPFKFCITDIFIKQNKCKNAGQSHTALSGLLYIVIDISCQPEMYFDLEDFRMIFHFSRVRQTRYEMVIQRNFRNVCLSADIDRIAFQIFFNIVKDDLCPSDHRLFRDKGLMGCQDRVFRM